MSCQVVGHDVSRTHHRDREVGCDAGERLPEHDWAMNMDYVRRSEAHRVDNGSSSWPEYYSLVRAKRICYGWKEDAF
jgi:hypothetical protein